MAVAEGFEPSVGDYPTLAFEASTFGRSDTPPSRNITDAPEDDQIARSSRNCPGEIRGGQIPGVVLGRSSAECEHILPRGRHQ